MLCRPNQVEQAQREVEQREGELAAREAAAQAAAARLEAQRAELDAGKTLPICSQQACHGMSVCEHERASQLQCLPDSLTEAHME